MNTKAMFTYSICFFKRGREVFVQMANKIIFLNFRVFVVCCVHTTPILNNTTDVLQRNQIGTKLYLKAK